jgi:hypothetical protein
MIESPLHLNQIAQAPKQKQRTFSGGKLNNSGG